jgi:hypothetical protein
MTWSCSASFDLMVSRSGEGGPEEAEVLEREAFTADTPRP